MNDTQQEPLGFADYLVPLWRRRWLVLSIVVVVTCGTFAYFSARPKEYRGTATLFLRSFDVGGLGDTTSNQDPEREAANSVRLAKSRLVTAEAARRVRYRGDSDSLLKHVKIKSVQGADFLTISATRASPEAAARLANVYSDAFISVRSASTRNRARQARLQAQAQLARLTRQGGSSAAMRNLRTRIRNLGEIESLPGLNAERVDQAVPKQAAVAPRPKRNALFAFVLSLILAGAMAYALERVERRLNRTDDAEEAFGYPLLAEIPRSNAFTRNGTPEIADPLKEPFRGLQTSLQVVRADRPFQTLVVTSAAPKEGKSTVVRNLALAYGEAGHRVAVVEADLRHPVLSQLLQVDGGPGLTDVLAGQAELAEALRPVSVPALVGDVMEQQASGGSVEVLTSGSQPSNPPAVLGSERLPGVLHELSEGHDVVLVDSPPLLPVSDTLPLIRVADGVVLVTRLGVSTQDTTRRVVELLRRVPDANVLGIVVSDVAQPTLREGYQYD